MVHLRILVAFSVCVVVVAATPVASAAQQFRQLDYLNDKLRIPDSEKFEESTYVETGVGLTFGVDRRLSYYAGNYAEAAKQFANAVKRYPYKSEIWVFLSRSYFFEKEPGRTQDVLKQAAEVMPDLNRRLWDPLLAGLNREIRKRANDIQLQVGYYSRGPEDYHNLFRLYRYLEDYPSASNVIHSAETTARVLRERAVMSSGKGQRLHMGKRSHLWSDRGKDLRGEMEVLGVAVVGDEKRQELAERTEEEDLHLELREAKRLLQLRIDYYQFLVKTTDYRQLFDNYVELGEAEKAAGVIEAVELGIRRLDLKTVEAVDYQEELDIENDIEEFKALKAALKTALEESSADRDGLE